MRAAPGACPKGGRLHEGCCYVQAHPRSNAELIKAKNDFGNIGSGAILMNVENGEILSLVSLPDYDLNKRTLYLQNFDANSEQSLKISFLIDALKNVVDRNQKNKIEEKQKTLFSYLQEIDLEENQRRNVLFHYMFRYLTRTISVDKLKYAAKIANKMYAQSLVLRRNIGSAASKTSVRRRLPESVNRGRKQRNRYIAANQNLDHQDFV